MQGHKYVLAGVAYALVRAASRLISTPSVRICKSQCARPCVESSLNTVHLEYARTQICACRRGVRTRACRVETHLDAWVSRTEICDKRGTGVEMSLVSTRHARVRTPRRLIKSQN